MLILPWLELNNHSSHPEAKTLEPMDIVSEFYIYISQNVKIT